MGGLGMVLGGALSGFGAGIAKQGEMDYEQRRQLALENVRAKREQSNIRTQGEEQRTSQDNAALNNNWLNSEQKERDVNGTIVVNKANTANEIALAKFKSTLKMDEDQAAAALDIKNKLEEASQTASEYRVAEDGSIVAFSKTGGVLARSRPGIFTPPSVGKTSEPAENPLQKRGAGASTPPPRSRPPLSSFGS